MEKKTRSCPRMSIYENSEGEWVVTRDPKGRYALAVVGHEEI